MSRAASGELHLVPRASLAFSGIGEGGQSFYPETDFQLKTPGISGGTVTTIGLWLFPGKELGVPGEADLVKVSRGIMEGAGLTLLGPKIFRVQPL